MGFEGKPGCCARSVLAAEQDFKEQRAGYVDSWLSFTPSSTVNSTLLRVLVWLQVETPCPGENSTTARKINRASFLYGGASSKA